MKATSDQTPRPVSDYYPCIARAPSGAPGSTEAGPRVSGNRLWRRWLTWACGLVLLAGWGVGCRWTPFELSDAAYEEQLRAEARARAADPKWKPSTEQVGIIQVGDKGSPRDAVRSFCLHTNGHLLVCWGGRGSATSKADASIRVFNAEGKQVESWALPSTPEAICVAADGTVFVGGAGRLHKLDAQGKILASAQTPVANQAVALDKAALEKRFGRTLSPEDLARYRDSLVQRKLDVPGLAVSGSDLFVVCPSMAGYGYSVWRMDLDLKNPVEVIKGLAGCCGQMDIQAKDGKLWVAHNGRHRVESYDRQGKLLGSFGRHDRKAADAFGGCCEPKNLRLGSDGNVYAAESGPPVTIKRFSPEGKFRGVVALPQFSTGCVRVTIEVSADCQRFYILEPGANAIRVFAAKGTPQSG